MKDNNKVTDETKPSLSNTFHNRLFTSTISIVFSPENLTGQDKENHKRKKNKDLYTSINIALIISQHSKLFSQLIKIFIIKGL